MRRRSLLIAAAFALALALGVGACSKDKSSAQGAPPVKVSVSVVAPPTPIPIFAAPPDLASPPADATKTASGLAFKVLTPGKGSDHPGPGDRVKVHYVGWTKAGYMFDSNAGPRDPITLRLGGTIAGLREALELMVAGEKRRLWIPAVLAYGQEPHAGAPAGDLVYDLELLEIVAPKPPAYMP